MASRSSILCVALAVAAIAGGCSSNTAAGRDSKVRRNLTPELMTLYQRPIDYDNRMTLTFDENLRMANEDWARMWFLDRPSRLARERVPQ